jgi:nitroreductase
MRELLRSCIEAATHAPSKHNAQPWRFEVAGGVVELHADGSRAMPVSDPAGRELVLACGAALYALRLALRCAGYEPLTVLLPEGPDFSLLATVAPGDRVTPTPDDLARRAAIATRRTDRGPLDGDALDPRVPFLLQDAAEREGATLHLLGSPGLRLTLSGLVAKADELHAADEAFEAEKHAWSGQPNPRHEHGDRPLPAVLWTREDRPADWLRAGMALESVLLRATVLGVSASFLNGPLELPALRAKLRDELALPGFPQVALRLGIGTPGAPAPRRAVDEVASGV